MELRGGHCDTAEPQGIKEPLLHCGAPWKKGGIVTLWNIMELRGNCDSIESRFKVKELNFSQELEAVCSD